MQTKASAPSKFTKKQQARLDEVAEMVIDLEEQIELAGDEAPAKPAPTSAYKPEPGTESFVHLKIIRGQRFDENTGKPLNNPYAQMFTYGEYLNFVKKASLVGYTIVEELYNPYKK